MWCEAKGIDCHYCGVYGECRGSCGLPDAEPSTLGTSSSYSVRAMTEKSIDDIKREAVREFAEELKENYFLFLGKEICSDIDAEYIGFIIDELLKEYDK